MMIPEAIPGHEDILCGACHRVVPIDECGEVISGLPHYQLNRLTLCPDCRRRYGASGNAGEQNPQGVGP